MSCSPPTESKIRQISQGVEDMTWKHIQKDSTSDRDHDMDAPESRADHQTATEVSDTHEEGQGAQRGDDLEEEPIKAKAAGGDEIAVPPVLLQGENPPQVTDGAGEDEHAGQADPAEVPPDAQPSDPVPRSGNPEVHPEVSATSAIQPTSASSSQPHSRRSSESEAEAEKGVKRKLRDRTVSERLIPGEVEEDTNATVPKTGVTKRQRDDADTDASPRLTKRPTPPPEESEGDTQKAEASSSQSSKADAAPAAPFTPKLVRAVSRSRNFLCSDRHVAGWFCGVRIKQLSIRGRNRPQYLQQVQFPPLPQAVCSHRLLRPHLPRRSSLPRLARQASLLPIPQRRLSLRSARVSRPLHLLRLRSPALPSGLNRLHHLPSAAAVSRGAARHRAIPPQRGREMHSPLVHSRLTQQEAHKAFQRQSLGPSERALRQAKARREARACWRPEIKTTPMKRVVMALSALASAYGHRRTKRTTRRVSA